MQTKHAMQSKTIVGVVVTMLTGLVAIWLTDSPDGLAVAAATTKGILETIGIVGGSVTAIVGRLTATKRVTV